MDLDIQPREFTTDDDNNYSRLSGQRIPIEKSFWSRKGNEAYDSGVYDSIKKEGVVNPVEVTTNRRSPMIANGYHRVAAVNALDEAFGKVNSFVPVTFKKNEKEVHDLPIHWMRDDEPLYPETHEDLD